MSSLDLLGNLSSFSADTPLFSYNPLASVLQDIISTLKSHESKIQAQNDLIKELKDRDRDNKAALQKALHGLDGLDGKVSSLVQGLKDKDIIDNAELEKALSQDIIPSAMMVDQNEYADMMKKLDKNNDKVNEMDSKLNDLGNRLDNLSSLLRTVSDIAKNGEALADEAKRKATDALNGAKSAESKVDNLKYSLEGKLNSVDDKLNNVKTTADNANKIANTADKASKENDKKLKDIQTKIDDLLKNSSNSSEIDKLKKLIDDLNAKYSGLGDSLKKLMEEKEKQNAMLEKLKPDVPIKTPKSREPVVDSDYATKKEVQMLRNILLRFESDLQHLFGILQNNPESLNLSQFSDDGISPQKLQNDDQQLFVKVNNPALFKDESKVSNVSNSSLLNGKNGDIIRPSTSGSVLETSSHLLNGSQQKPVSPGFFSERNQFTDDDPDEARRLSYNLVRRLPARDIRLQYANSVPLSSEEQEDKSNVTNKMYNTLAVTLNELLGRVDILESAVAELQNLIEKLKMNDKKDSIDDIKSALSDLQRSLASKADIDNVIDVERFRDLENKLVKKSDRSEVQELANKILANQTPQRPSALSAQVLQPKDVVNVSSPSPAKIDSTIDISTLKDIINAHTNDINILFKTKADRADIFKELTDLREALDRLDQVKADANIVARKAEREYVDNLMDRLKKDFETFVNNLNTHTSDLFAKDLEYLKGLLDQKADKRDMKKIKEFLQQFNQDAAKVDGGLAGHKQFRCLSCNRTMESMKSRPSSLNFTNFVNHLPNPKNKLQPRKALDSTQNSTFSRGSPSFIMKHESEVDDGNLPPISR